jgi:GNAT superfamily N-acetyltransferase
MWHVERARDSDAVELARLYRKVWLPYKKIFSGPLMDNRMASAKDIRASMKDKTYFAVRDSGMIVGVARATIAHESCLLDRMVVLPDYQGRGVGAALTQTVIDHARENNARKVWLDTSPKLEAAIALYEKMGFVEAGFFRKHYWGEDILFYEMIL